MSSDIVGTSAKYCPACGVEVSQSQSINADDSVFASGEGIYKNGDGHVVIEGAILSVYVHAEADQ